MTISKFKKIFANITLITFVMLFVFSNIAMAEAAQKKKYKNWQGVAADMAAEFDKASQAVKDDEYKEAYKHINSAYFGHYEIQGFEKNVLHAISRSRVDHIESKFRNIKHVLVGNDTDTEKQVLLEMIENLKVKVYRDAMVLDGAVDKNADDSVGIAVYGDGEIPDTLSLDTSQVLENQNKSTEPASKEVDPKKKNWFTFITAFGLLLREGLEAILVIVAIIAYLIKTNNRHMLKSVYIGVGAAVVASIVLALLIELLLGGSGEVQELIEGWTMFLAVGVLFYVSHWMLSKSSDESWKNYIDGKVQQSIDKRSQMTLVFAAFLAVLREGAELILFYKAEFSGGRSEPMYILYGILAGTVVLIIVYLIFRFTTIKLPLRPFFIFTSVLLFLMCISFMGKGVIELTEANVIIGGTMIPALSWLQVDLLNITNRAETLIPQIMLAIASISLLVANRKKSKEIK